MNYLMAVAVLFVRFISDKSNKSVSFILTSFRLLQRDCSRTASLLCWIVEGGIASAHEETAIVEDHLIFVADRLPCLALVDAVREGSHVTTWVEIAVHNHADVLHL